MAIKEPWSNFCDTFERNGWLFSVQHLEEHKHHSSLIILDSSFIIRSSWDAQSFIVHHSSFVILHSSFIIHHPSSFIIHHSSFSIHHSAFIIDHSAFIIRHSSFINQSTIDQKSIKNQSKIDKKSIKNQPKSVLELPRSPPEPSWKIQEASWRKKSTNFRSYNKFFSVGQSNFCYTFENKPSKIDQKSILFFEDVSNENTIFAQKWCFCSRHPQKNTQNRLKILPRGLQVTFKRGSGRCVLCVGCSSFWKHFVGLRHEI